MRERERERERRQSGGRVWDLLQMLPQEALPHALQHVRWPSELAARREGIGAEGGRRTALAASEGIGRWGDGLLRVCGGG